MTNALRLQFLMQSNLMLRANFVTNPFVATKGTYRGLFEDTNVVSHDHSGSITATIAESGAYTASLRFGGTTAALSGQLGVDGKATKQIRVQSTNLLTVTLCLDFNAGADQLTGQVAGADWVSAILAFRAAPFPKTSPAPFAGRYTMFISGDTNRGGPAGHSVATVIASASGTVTLSATLSDGTKTTQAGIASKDGWWPLYAPLYRGKGSILGWLTFTNESVDSLLARIHWIKPAVSADPLYPGGFTNVTMGHGAPYSIPLMTNYLAAHPNFCVAIKGLGIEPQSSCVTRGAGYTWNGPGFRSLKLDLPSGLWTGSYTNPMNARLVPARFVILAGSGSLYGHVLGTNVSAAIERLEVP